MKILTERYRTQTRLLASTAPDGQRAEALDTRNQFVYSTAYGGWQQLVPVDGIAGQPLVALEDRGLSAFDTHNRLVPAGGTAGQLVHADGDGETRFTTRDNVDTTSVTLPIDFSDGASHTYISQTIPGGSIGPHGFFRLTALAYVITNATRTVALSFGGGGAILTSGNMVSNANQCTLRISAEGLADGTVGSGHGFALIPRVTTARFTGATTSPVINDDMANGSYVADTGNDWTFSAAIQASGVVSTQAVLGWAVLEYGYIT